MTRYKWTEDRVGDLTAIIRRDRHRHYAIRVYRGSALAGIFSSLSKYSEWKADLA